MNFSIFIIIYYYYYLLSPFTCIFLLLFLMKNSSSDLLSHSSYDCYTVIVLWLDIQIYDLSKLGS